MRGKILFTLGLGIGYVFGTRAGRARYNEIKSAALRVWNDPRIQEQVAVATDFVKDKAPEVVDFVASNAKKVAAKVDEVRASASQPAPTTSRKPAAKRAAATKKAAPKAAAKPASTSRAATTAKPARATGAPKK